MDNMTGAEKAKEIRNSIFALLTDLLADTDFI